MIQEENNFGFDSNTNNSEPEKKYTPTAKPVYDEEDFEEQVIKKDYNSVKIQITKQTPMVVFWGAGASGKTMAIVRLTKYLNTIGHSVKPIPNFRDDTDYARLCDKFDELVMSPIAAKGNDDMDFMMLNVLDKNNNDVCQLLEAPGEAFFTPNNPNNVLPKYLNTILTNHLPKIYIFFLEIDWQDDLIRKRYADKIVTFCNNIRSSDKIIILCNKANNQQQNFFKGTPQTEKFRHTLRHQYESVFNKLGGNKGGFFSMFKSESHKYDFIVFSSALFNQDLIDKKIQHISDEADFYPRNLWNAILKGVKGVWF